MKDEKLVSMGYTFYKLNNMSHMLFSSLSVPFARVFSRLQGYEEKNNIYISRSLEKFM